MNLRELLQVDSTATLNFFHSELKDIVEGERVTGREIIYVASILASYAQTSTCETAYMPPMSSLSQAFDLFVASREELKDPEILEIAGAQSLFLTGFFREQMKRRHNVRWYDTLGGQFYAKASFFSKTKKQRILFGLMSEHFPLWTKTCSSLQEHFRKNSLPRFS